MTEKPPSILFGQKQSHRKVMAIAIVVIVQLGLVAFVVESAHTGHQAGFSITLEDGWLDSYYVRVKPTQKYGFFNLVKELNDLKWVKPYQFGLLDCSEMSAYLEWHLENEGWHALIVVGDSPSGSGRHAWLLVETRLNGYMPVESTIMRVVVCEDPNYYNYFKYDRIFETIQDALAYSATEFDWWQSG